MPIDIVLCHPEIPQNAGNVARTCAAIGARLHLVHPLGFYLSNRHLKRAGLDYWHLVDICEHASIQDLWAHVGGQGRFWLYAGHGRLRYDEPDYRSGDLLIFGSESRGLPPELLAAHPERTVRIPMRPDARSLNLANSVAIAAYGAVGRLRPDWY